MFRIMVATLIVFSHSRYKCSPNSFPAMGVLEVLMEEVVGTPFSCGHVRKSICYYLHDLVPLTLKNTSSIRRESLEFEC